MELTTRLTEHKTEHPASTLPVFRHEVESTVCFAPYLVPLTRRRRAEGARERVQGASWIVIGTGGVSVPGASAGSVRVSAWVEPVPVRGHQLEAEIRACS